MIRTCERRPQGEKCVTDKQEQRRCSESQIPGDLPLGLLTEVGKEAGKGTVLTCKLFLKASEMKCNYLCGRGGEREVHSFFKDKSYLGDGVESAPVRWFMPPMPAKVKAGKPMQVPSVGGRNQQLEPLLLSAGV